MKKIGHIPGKECYSDIYNILSGNRKTTKLLQKIDRRRYTEWLTLTENTFTFYFNTGLIFNVATRILIYKLHVNY